MPLKLFNLFLNSSFVFLNPKLPDPSDYKALIIQSQRSFWTVNPRICCGGFATQKIKLHKEKEVWTAGVQ